MTFLKHGISFRGYQLARVLCRMYGYPDGDYSKSYYLNVMERERSPILLDDVSQSSKYYIFKTLHSYSYM